MTPESDLPGPAHDVSPGRRLALRLDSALLRPAWCTAPDCASLRYVVARVHPVCAIVDALHIHGVPAERLHALQVRDDRGLLFEMCSMADALGRRVSAGEIVQSMCRQWAPHRLSLTSETFQRALRAAHTVVELEVRIQTGQTIDAIALHGDLMPE